MCAKGPANEWGKGAIKKGIGAPGRVVATHVDRCQGYAGMRGREHPEQLVRERLSDLGHPLEVQHHVAEGLKTLMELLRLGARDQLLPLVLGQPHGDGSRVGEGGR